MDLSSLEKSYGKLHPNRKTTRVETISQKLSFRIKNFPPQQGAVLGETEP
ncbi:MAG: hypothetical protein ABI045_07420 [Flavobacteriales bacterium]